MAASCTPDGLTAGSACSRCGEALTAQEVIPALGHTPTTVIDEQDATCTQDGFTALTKCDRCNLLLSEQELIPALGHELAELPAVAATCTQAGLSAGSHCDRCDEDVVPQVTVPALGHSFTEWTQTASTACTSQRERDCTRCNLHEKKTIQKKEHQQSDNYYDFDCVNCGVTLVEIDEVLSSVKIDPCVEELHIPDGVEAIKAYAFFGANLRLVFIPKSVGYIGAYAFGMCAEDLVICIPRDFDTSEWDPEWNYGNGDYETPFTVITYLP